MPNLQTYLLNLCLPLIGWVSLGFFLGRKLPKTSPTYLGKYLFWFGVPISILAFLRRADLSGWVLIAPITAWIAILVGAGFAWMWIDLGLSDERLKSFSRGLVQAGNGEETTSATNSFSLATSEWSRPTQGSFLLAMMVGNTAFLGYPIILGLVGPQHFAWALFFDLLGTTLGVYGLGVAVSAYFGTAHKHQGSVIQALLKTPALWCMGLGLILRTLPFPPLAEEILQGTGWTSVNLALVMIGMQLSQLSALRHIKKALTCLAIKMLLVPLVVGTGLMFFGVTGAPRLVLVLQMAMPPAFATVVFAETFNLDRELAVTTLVLGYPAILFILPIWMWLFGT